MKSIFKINYNLYNTKILASQVPPSVFIVNVITPIFLVYVTYSVIEHIHAYIWLLLHIIVGSLRFISAKKISAKKVVKQEDLDIFGNRYLTLVILTALLYAYMMWTTVLSSATDITIIMVSTTIIALVAGSISTLVSIYGMFAAFVTIGMVSQISAMIYLNIEFFYVYSIILFVFSIMLLKAGYNQNRIIINLASLKDSFETIYNKSSDGIIITQKNRFKDCNPAILKMFQIEAKDEFLSEGFAKLMPKYQEDGRLSIKKMLEMANIALRDGYNHFEWTYKKHDGTFFWVDIVLTKIYINGEELLHSTYRDITDKKYLERKEQEFKDKLQNRVKEEIEKNRKKDQQILQQSKLAQMGEMISMIAHQWRQPLSAISATSGSISLKAELGNLDDELTKELAQKITGYAQHLSATIDDFRNFFKDDKEKEKTNFEEIVQETINIVKLSLDTAQIEVITELNSTQELYTYKNEIKQVLLNIIKNAEDVLKENKIQNPKITIITKGLLLLIKDNAGGIPKDIMDKIFEPYFSTKLQKDGTGLGLYMSKTIIDEHCGGCLSAENDIDGAVFKINLEKDKT